MIKDNVTFFEKRQKLFKFRKQGSKQSNVPKGQYVFPFTVTLPQKSEKVSETVDF